MGIASITLSTAFLAFPLEPPEGGGGGGGGPGIFVTNSCQ